MKMFFAPNGEAITRISSYSFDSPNVSIEDGAAALDGHDDFPDFSPIAASGLGCLLYDMDSNEWLEQHCRLIETAEDYDVWGPDALKPCSWSDEIVGACRRVADLAGALWAAERLDNWLPIDIRADPTINAAISTIIIGRVRGEIDTLQAEIAAYREGRVEPTTLVEPEPTDEIEDALALMRGGVA